MSDAPIPGRGASASPPLMVGAAARVADRRTIALIWGLGIVLLGGVSAFLLAQGEIRTITLILLTVLGLICLAPRRGVFIMLAFLPFMYFLRRQVLYFNEFSQRDPILLFPPIVTIGMFLGILIFYSQDLYRHMRQSALLKTVMALLGLFLAQMLNPLQGNILVGIAGALYFIIPMLWVFMGTLMRERDLRRVFALIMLIGVVTALYGTYQHYFGLTDVEKYELESKGFLKTFGSQVRVMSTFAGLGDFSAYLSLSGLLFFAHYWRNKTNVAYLALFCVVIFALLWVAIRTSLLVLSFGIITYFIVHSRNPGLILARGLLALVGVGGLYGYLYTRTPGQLFEEYRTSNPFIVHTLSGMAHPTKESTFQKRIQTWRYVVGPGLIEQPFGRGIGSTTTAAMKFSGGQRLEVDSYLFEIIYGSSVFAAILFVLVLILFFRGALALAIRAPGNHTYKVIIALMAIYSLGSIFGVDVRDTINGPFAWLLVGFVVHETHAEREEGGEEPVAAA